MQDAIWKSKVARTWSVVRSGDAEDGKWTLVKGEPVASQAVQLGEQSREPFLPPLADFLRSIDSNRALHTDKAVHSDLCPDRIAEVRIRPEDPSGSLATRQRRPSNVVKPRIESAGAASLFQTASGKAVALDGVSVSRARDLLVENDGTPMETADFPAGPLAADLEFAGATSLFQTASGKAVTLDAVSVSRARVLFAGNEGTPLGTAAIPASPNIASASRRSLDVAARKEIRPVDPTVSRLISADTSVPKTAVPLPVEEVEVSSFPAPAWQRFAVPNAALRKAEALLEGRCGPEPPPYRQSRTLTGNPQRIQSSEWAVKRAEGLLDGSSDAGKDGKFCPFAALPDSALRRAEAILERRDLMQPFSGREGGTRRGDSLSCRKYQVSESAIRNAEELLESSANRRLYDARGADAAGSFCKVTEKQVKVLQKNEKEADTASKSEGGLQNKGGESHVPGREKAGLERGTGASGFMAPRQNTSVSPQQGVTTAFRIPRLQRPLELKTASDISFNQGTSLCKESDPGKQVRRVTSFHKKPTKTCKWMQEYFGGPPGLDSERHPDREVAGISASTAAAFRVKHLAEGKTEYFGAEDFRRMLCRAGAESAYVASEWVTNHYKWIIWKLASYERSYPMQAAGKYLTRDRVFNELLHRYHREYRDGHRSALKRITERDSPSSQVIVLCISSTNGLVVDGVSSNRRATVEVTDGWYRLTATLDTALSQKLRSGKLFVGQKLRVCGAVFHGYTDGTPPLVAFPVSSLAIHINGTFRAHWADRLGFGHVPPVPLALKCVKNNGGPVAATVVVVTRLYPILYKERLRDGRSVVRCARAENLASSQYDARRNSIIDATKLKLEEEGHNLVSGNDPADEGALLFARIVNAGEPELIFATLTKSQRQSLDKFQLRRQIAMQKVAETRIQEALCQADLLSRDVSPFLQVRVSGVLAEDSLVEFDTTEGFITIWGPDDDQIRSLKEGTIHRVSDLTTVPDRNFTSADNLVHLRATRATKWQELSQEAARKLQFDYAPRIATRICRLEELADGREFDVACVVLHIGEVDESGFHRRQWVFVTDGSEETEDSGSGCTSLLAIEHHASHEAFMPFEANLLGCVVGFCNLKKLRLDSDNALWVAESSLLAFRASKLTSASCKHLEQSADVVRKWAAENASEIEFLRERVTSELIK